MAFSRNSLFGFAMVMLASVASATVAFIDRFVEIAFKVLAEPLSRLTVWRITDTLAPAGGAMSDLVSGMTVEQRHRMRGAARNI